jgi:hypothetical protein
MTAWAASGLGGGTGVGRGVDVGFGVSVGRLVGEAEKPSGANASEPEVG